MNLIELEASVATIRDRIFSYSIDNLQNEVLVLVEEVYSQTNNLSNEELTYANDILNYLMAALSNKDYLALGDILKYELLPLISEITDGDIK
jgi:hypothetical protein